MDIENQKLEEALRLSRISDDKNNIGIQKEHTLHRVIKFYLSNDLANHEIPIGKRFADVKIDNVVYEVQTKSFNLLRDKLKAFLPNYEVWIVHPMAFNKHYYLNNQYGELIKEKNSPRHIYPLDITRELYRIKDYLLNEHLHFKIIMMDMDEYRIETNERTYHSKGYERDNQVPKKILKIYDIYQADDWFKILNEYEFPESFTSKEFYKIVHIPSSHSSTALNVLNHLGIVKRIGTKNRSYLYTLNKKDEI